MWQQLLEYRHNHIFLLVLIAFYLGLLIGFLWRRAGKKPFASKESKGDEAFFKGIRYILSNEHDHAIEEFTKSVQVNSDTIETYVALGNLYRSKGDIDRAIRIRQSIILRPNIDEQMKLRALFDLGLDYRKGGFLNRALKTFSQVAQKDVSNIETLKEMERIYEELKDWDNAFGIRQKISRISKINYNNILAHYQVEMGKQKQQSGEISRAISLFNKAASTHKECIDAWLHLGDLYFERGEHKKAISIWKKGVMHSPHLTFLVYRRIEGAYSKMKNLKPVENFLKECVQANSDAFTHLAFARFLYNVNDIEGALKEIKDALELTPSFWDARKFKGEILLSRNREQDILSDYGELIECLDIPCLRFQCEQCGFEPSELQWQCPQCKKWDTIKLVEATTARSNFSPQPKDDSGLESGETEKE